MTPQIPGEFKNNLIKCLTQLSSRHTGLIGTTKTYYPVAQKISGPFSAVFSHDFFGKYLGQVGKAFSDFTKSLDTVGIEVLSRQHQKVGSKNVEYVSEDLTLVYEEMEKESIQALSSYKELGGWFTMICSAISNAFVFGSIFKMKDSGHLIRDNLLVEFREKLAEKLINANIIPKTEKELVLRLLKKDIHLFDWFIKNQNTLPFRLSTEKNSILESLDLVEPGYDLTKIANGLMTVPSENRKPFMEFFNALLQKAKTACPEAVERNKEFWTPDFGNTSQFLYAETANWRSFLDAIDPSKRDLVLSSIKDTILTQDTLPYIHTVKTFINGFFATKEMDESSINTLCTLLIANPSWKGEYRKDLSLKLAQSYRVQGLSLEFIKEKIVKSYQFILDKEKKNPSEINRANAPFKNDKLQSGLPLLYSLIGLSRTYSNKEDLTQWNTDFMYSLDDFLDLFRSSLHPYLKDLLEQTMHHSVNRDTRMKILNTLTRIYHLKNNPIGFIHQINSLINTLPQEDRNNPEKISSKLEEALNTSYIFPEKPQLSSPTKIPSFLEWQVLRPKENLKEPILTVNIGNTTTQIGKDEYESSGYLSGLVEGKEEEEIVEIAVDLSLEDLQYYLYLKKFHGDIPKISEQDFLKILPITQKLSDDSFILSLARCVPSISIKSFEFLHTRCTNQEIISHFFDSIVSSIVCTVKKKYSNLSFQIDQGVLYKELMTSFSDLQKNLNQTKIPVKKLNFSNDNGYAFKEILPKLLAFLSILFPEVQTLSFLNQYKLEKIEGFWPNLKQLEVKGCPNLQNLDFLKGRDKLDFLDLTGSIQKLQNPTEVFSLAKTVKVPITDFLSSSSQETTLSSFLDKVPNKTEVLCLDLQNAPLSTETLAKIAKDFPNLQEIDISGTAVKAIPLMPKLKKLTATNCENLSDLSKLSANIEFVNLRGAENLSAFPNKDFSKLTSLSLDSCPKITELDFLKDKPSLDTLNIQNTKLKDIFIDCENIKSIYYSHQDQITQNKDVILENKFHLLTI